MSCLGDALAALVDGELDDAGRERAHRHLARCEICRAEVDGLRRLKARLSGLAVPAPPEDLTARLLRLGGQPLERDLGPVLPVLPGGPVSARPAGRPSAPTGPAGRVRSHRVARRRAATSSAVALLGVAAALALDTPAARPATTPVDPASDAFVTEFVSTTADAVTGPVAAVPTARTTSLTTFVPVTRAALLTTGGARTTR